MTFFEVAIVPDPLMATVVFQRVEAVPLHFFVTGQVTRVVDGVAQQLPPPAPTGPPVQLERITPIAPDV